MKRRIEVGGGRVQHRKSGSGKDGELVVRDRGVEQRKVGSAQAIEEIASQADELQHG